MANRLSTTLTALILLIFLVGELIQPALSWSQFLLLQVAGVILALILLLIYRPRWRSTQTSISILLLALWLSLWPIFSPSAANWLESSHYSLPALAGILLAITISWKSCFRALQISLVIISFGIGLVELVRLAFEIWPNLAQSQAVYTEFLIASGSPSLSFITALGLVILIMLTGEPWLSPIWTWIGLSINALVLASLVSPVTAIVLGGVLGVLILALIRRVLKSSARWILAWAAIAGVWIWSATFSLAFADRGSAINYLNHVSGWGSFFLGLALTIALIRGWFIGVDRRMEKGAKEAKFDQVSLLPLMTFSFISLSSFFWPSLGGILIFVLLSVKSRKAQAVRIKLA